MARAALSLFRAAAKVLFRPAGGPAILVLLAVVVNLGPLHRNHDGDSLVPVIESLYRWEPFLWEQDRYGMLVPLLTTWVENPFHNLLLQNFIACAMTLGGFFALARVATRSLWVVTGATAAALFLAAEPDVWRFRALTTYGPFGHGLAVAAAGAAVLLSGERLGGTRFVLGAALLVIGAWVNTAAAFILGPAVLVRGLLISSGQSAAGAAGPGPDRGSAREQHREAARRDGDQPRQWETSRGGALLAALGRAMATRTGITLAVVACAFLVSMAVSASAEVRIHYAMLPPAEWIGCWVGLMGNALAEGLLNAGHLIALGILLASGAVAVAVHRDRLRAATVALVPLAGGAVALVGLMGAINWTKFQALAARYSLGAVLTMDVAVAGFAVVALLESASERVRRLASGAAVAVLATVAIAQSFPPSLVRVRRDIDRTLGARTAEVIDAGVTHVAGNYWTVWPTVFHANLVLHERGSDRKIWGIAHRAAPTANRWARIPLARWRVAAIPEEFGDPFTATCMGNYGVPPLRSVGRLATFTLFIAEIEAAESNAP